MGQVDLKDYHGRDVEALLQRFTPFSLDDLKPEQAEATNNPHIVNT